MTIVATNAERAQALFEASLGQSEGAGEWLALDQGRVDAFADITEDRQFIHVDPHACAQRSPWGVPIAHGFLTLSLLPHLLSTVPVAPERVDGIVVGVNYGFEKVRFLNAVRVGARIRAASVVKAVELRDHRTLHVTREVTVEVDGERKPALVAEWIMRFVYD